MEKINETVFYIVVNDLLLNKELTEEMHLSLRLIKNAVHRVQQSHLLVKVQNSLFGELDGEETQKTTHK